MSTTVSTPIENILHQGIVCFDEVQMEIEGMLYPFCFLAEVPTQKEWPFRMIRGGDESGQLREERLTKLLELHKFLCATYDEIPTHAVGILTIFVPRESGGLQTESGRAEFGKKLLYNLQDPAAGIALPSAPLPAPAPKRPPAGPSASEDLFFPS